MSSKGIWKKEIRASRWKFAAGFSILLLTAVSIPIFFDFAVKTLDITPIPEFARSQVAQLKDFRFFVWSQWFGKNMTQIGALLAVIFGSTLISSEVTRKTIQFLLIKPIRREVIFTVKYIVNLVNIAMITVLSSLSLYITLLAVDRPVPNMAAHTVLAVAGLSVVYSLAVCFSTVFEQSIKSTLASIFVLFLLYIPGAIPSIEKLSLFYQMSGPGLYSGQGFPWAALAVFAAVSMVLYYVGRNRFVSRDF